MKYNTDVIKLRRCDLHGVFTMMSMGNKKVRESAWDLIELMIKNVK